MAHRSKVTSLTASRSTTTLAQRCKACFDLTMRMRGEDYHKAGAVSEPVVSSRRISATVKGTRRYHVDLRWQALDHREVLVACDCPHYAKGALCKHTWALILKLDAAGLGRMIPGSDPLYVLHDDEAEDELSVYDDDDLEGMMHSPADEKPWLTKLKTIRQRNKLRAPKPMVNAGVERPRVAYYVLDIEDCRQSGAINIHFFHRERSHAGSLGSLKRDRAAKENLPLYEDPIDREIMATLLLYGQSPQVHSYYAGNVHRGEKITFAKAALPESTEQELLAKLARTQRFVRLPGGKAEPVPLSFDEGPAWRFELDVGSESDTYVLSGRLYRDGSQGEERINLDRPLLLLSSGVVVFDDRLARLEADRHFAWIEALRSREIQPIPKADADELVESLCADDESPRIRWPDDLQWSTLSVTPLPALVVGSSEKNLPIAANGIPADLRFIYDGVEVSHCKSSAAIFDKSSRRLISRDLNLEQKLLTKLLRLEGVTVAAGDETPLRIARDGFSSIVQSALEWKWQVMAFGRQVKTAGDFDVKITSGIDWFELEGRARFDGGAELSLPALLSALERKDPLITLGDGTTGLLPVKWLEKYAALSKIANDTPSGLRFTRSQGALVAAWLGDDPISADVDFTSLQKAVRSLDQLKPRHLSRTFRGELRPYQNEGLAWLGFLAEVGFGGILADDMGLGKTVQVLAHLEAYYANPAKGEHRPSLIIVPKSLLFNWQEEAARFAPKLRILTYAGGERQRLFRDIAANDLILVTYSTLRLDIERLSQQDFQYVIADEAQAIKNADSQAHRACLAIRGRHRLAMTGTPVENSALDLMAILDFVSPGLLGHGMRGRMTRAATHGQLDVRTLSQLSKALKPFILRRTKEQVLKDLPDKTENTLTCELHPSEMRQYRELRDHYRARLKGEFARRGGLARSKIVVLEALLRLRQAACHPGLIDKKRANADSTKIETLVEQLKEVVSEGHKALVFSQFTSFLDIAARALDQSKLTHVRLDGTTSATNRQELVTRFQNDPNLSVFLISLKAGGVGLNLTAADYVFILDPWWNPAAESQAIDRAHRIGQKNKVIAYRLIAKDTVEEKIIELQKQKREIADAIISEDASLLNKLTPDDLEMLLS